MSGQQVGYTRVSSLDQNPDRQLDGVAVDRTFTDSASGRRALTAPSGLGDFDELERHRPPPAVGAQRIDPRPGSPTLPATELSSPASASLNSRRWACPPAGPGS